MFRQRRAMIATFAALSAALIMGCSALSGIVPQIPTMPPFDIPTMPSFDIPDVSGTATQDAVVNAATPESPLSGDWTTKIQSGQVVFHISRDGSKIYSADVNLKGWQCGGTTMTATLQVSADDWTIDGDQFSMTIDLASDPTDIETLTFDGAYDQSTQTWSGTWDGDEYGSHCGGDWTATKQ